MTHTSSRTWQWLGIILVLITLGAGYWYFSVRAGVRVNTTAGSEVGDGGLGAGLVGYWKLDEGTGTSAADASVNAITALTLTNGPTWTTGQIGSSIDFDGTNDYATTADNAALDFGDTSDFTLTGWFNRDTFVTTHAMMAKRSDYGAANVGYLASITASDEIYFEVSDGTDEYAVVTGTGMITSAGWHHIVITWDQDTATGTNIYIDGVKEDVTRTGTIGNIGDLSNASPFRIAVTSGTVFESFDGKIDEVRVYDRVLSDTEIVDLYKLTTPTGVDTGLVGYWAFGADDFRSTLVSDRSGARNTGTLVNTPTKTVGKIGQALSFASASTQYVNAGSNAIIDDIVNLSTCAWVKPNSSLTTYGDVVTKYTNAGVGWQMLIDYATSSVLVPSFYRVFTTTAGWWFAVATIPPNQWSHICVTYNNSSTTNDPAFYLNGVLMGTYETQAPVGTASAEASGDMYIGAYNNAGTPGELFDGVIDEPRVYNRIITASEVKALYDAGSADKVNTSVAQPAGTGNLESGLVGYWKLDEGSGTSAADSSVNAITAGTLTNGPTWVTGQIGSGVDFDGTNDYITVADNSLLDFGDTDDFTIAGWFNRDTFTSVEEMIVKYDGVNPGYHVFITDSAGGSTLQTQIYDGTDTYTLSGTTGFTGAGWHHFAVVWDQDSAANTELYVDGRPESATDGGTIGNIGSLANSVALTFGDRPGYGQPHDGKLDEIRIYDRALSADEIANLARLNSPTGVDTSLRGYWSMNAQDMTSTLAYDRSGARNTGTLTGSPTKAIGRVGQGVDFDGTDDYVTVADNAALDVTDAVFFTLSGWFNRDTFNSIDAIAAKRGGSLAAQPGYLLYVSAADQLEFEVSDGTDEYALSGGPGITSAGWHHFAVVWDPDSAANTELYLDGVPVGATETGTISNIGDLSNSQVFAIGSLSDNTYPFDGKLDEIRFHKRALTADEIKSLYELGAPDKSNTSVSTPQGTGRLDSGLVGYWKLDETTGSSASDGTTNGNAGTLTNMENVDWATGRIGNGLTFDGTNEYVAIGTSTALTGLSQFTACAWVNPVDNASTFPAIINTFDASSTDGWDFYLINGYTGGHGFGTSFIGSSGNVFIEKNSAAVTFGQWSHVCITQNGGNFSDMRLFLNGTATTSDSGSGSQTRLSDAGNPISIGRYADGSDYYNGQIDEVRVYDRVLSDEEIRQLYSLGVPTGTDTGLVGYWSFNGQDMTATTAYDRSGAGNDGTLTAGPVKTIGKLGQALHFDGADDYVNVGSAAIIDNLTNLSACAWVNPDTLPNGYSSIIAQMDNGGAEATFGFHDNGAGDLIEYYRSFSTTTGIWNSDRDVVPLGAWSHVCVTYNDSSVANDPVFYLNGAPIGVIETNTPVGTASSTASGDYYIGALDNGGSGDEFFDGKLDEVRLYNRILSASEVQALYNSGR